MKSKLIFLLIIFLSFSESGQCQRIKDIVDIQGVRSNPLTGIGLVTGLSNSGDSSLPSQTMLANILQDSGLNLSPSDFSGGNVALVMVTADLGPFDRKGTRINVVVSSIGDAKSLQGGRLLPTLLKGLDGEVYSIAAGSVSLAGWTVAGDKASITKNHQTVGQIPEGGIVEKEEIATFVEYIGSQRYITLDLRNKDFSTAVEIGKSINEIYAGIASAIDAGTIKVRVPEEISPKNIAKFIADITESQVQVDVPAIVIINERTGTIAVGENVGISPAQAICQGSMVVKIKEMENVSQPNTMFTDGATTEVTQETFVSAEEPKGALITVPRTVTVAELAKYLNAIGATPSDLIAIFNTLKEAGALQARLKIM